MTEQQSSVKPADASIGPNTVKKEEHGEDTENEVMLEMLKFMKEERLNRSPKREKEDGEDEKEEQSETIKTTVNFPVLKGVGERSRRSTRSSIEMWRLADDSENQGFNNVENSRQVLG